MVQEYLCYKWAFYFATPWAVACQAPLSTEFSRGEYWSGLPCPPPGDLLNPGIEPGSLTSPALAGGFFTISTTWEVFFCGPLYFFCHTFSLLIALCVCVCVLSEHGC